MTRHCSPDCVCMACRARRRSVPYVLDSEARFWRAARIVVLTAAIAVILVMAVYGGFYWMLGEMGL